MNLPKTRRKRIQWQGGTALRSVLLFVNFFMILVAYYLVKPASRSLFLEHSNSDALPYLWTASGLMLLVLVPGYQWILRRVGRMRVVLGSCVVVAATLLIFRGLFDTAGAPTAISFYIFVDIFSVVLVEQFWSLTNSVYDSREGKRWYGLIASGGLVGGFVGGLTASWLLEFTPLSTPDLISIAAVLVLLMMLLTGRLARAGLYREKPAVAAARREGDQAPVDFGLVWESIRSNRFLLLITLLLLFSQVCEPIVEYQFMHHVEATYTDQEQRTVFLSEFMSLLNILALGVNLVLTPLIHRYAGVIGGLMVQPVMLGLSALWYVSHADLRPAMAMKLTDRGLSYSINRASRELLYVGADAAKIFKVKAWIDMVGYRTFKIIGNIAIVAIGTLSWRTSEYLLAAVVLSICVAWALAVVALRSTRRAQPRIRSGAEQAISG